MKKAAEEKSPGTSSCWPTSRFGRMQGGAQTVALDAHPAALEHALAVIAAHGRRGHRGRRPSAYSAASRIADFTCALATGIR